MEKFGMSFGGGGGGGPGKKELLDTIDAQKKQLGQYQNRLKDVVRAYKSLLKEKEALEASLKVLTVSQEVDLLGQQQGGGTDGGGGDGDEDSVSGIGSASVTSDLPDDRCSVHSEDSVDTAASSSADTATSVASAIIARGEQGEGEEQGGSGEVPPGGPPGAGHSLAQTEASGSESGISSSSSGPPPTPPLCGATNTGMEADRRVLQLRTQLNTLTSSLATVSQEKSRMEASFQADKRVVKQEREELQNRLDEARRQSEDQLHTLEAQLAESKARVITQQHERAQETGDHVLMLRELQKLLQEERDLRQDAELRLEDTKETLLEFTQVVDQGAEYEARLRETIREREEMRSSLQTMEEERRRPDPRVEELTRELLELKEHYQQQLQQEIRKATQADARARDQTQAEEGRVASLEERVSELSELLGACENIRQRDLQTAIRLRERILQLDTENKTLAMAASHRGSSDLLSLDEANLDVNVLKEKMEKVKRLLLMASQRTNHPPGEKTLEIEKVAMEMETALKASDGDKASALYHQQELRQLKEEFERYKLRAQVVLKNKNTKDGTQAKELEETRDQLAELKEKYINLRIHSDDQETKQRRDLEERTQEQAGLTQNHKKDLENAEARHRDSLMKMEEELHKQRDRTMALLQEKDTELQRLRSTVLSYGLSGHRGGGGEEGDGRAMAAMEALADGGGVNGRDEALADAVARGEDESDPGGEVIAQALRLARSNESTLILYAEQLARKEVEVVSLRRQKHRLEDDLHRLTGKLVAHGERYEAESAELREQLDKLLRDQGREGSNLEYLKNVIYRFLTLPDPSGRQQTLSAILTILHFSPQEKQVVVRLQAQSWWQAGGAR